MIKIRSDKVYIMGVVNVTPDSFSDGGKFFDKSLAIEHALRLADEGADIIDIGGESTRPGAKDVGSDEELRRVIPVIEAISKKLKIASSSASSDSGRDGSPYFAAEAAMPRCSGPAAIATISAPSSFWSKY